jgi:hypothetical protein
MGQFAYKFEDRTFMVIQRCAWAHYQAEPALQWRINVRILLFCQPMECRDVD